MANMATYTMLQTAARIAANNPYASGIKARSCEEAQEAEKRLKRYRKRDCSYFVEEKLKDIQEADARAEQALEAILGELLKNDQIHTKSN